jgi:hypothetical protein
MEEKIIEIVKRCVALLEINGAVRKETIIHKAIEEALMEASKISSNAVLKEGVCEHPQTARGYWQGEVKCLRCNKIIEANSLL